MISRVRILAALTFVLLVSSYARAQTYSQSAAYAPLQNMLLTNGTANGGQCASTSLINSFQYLDSSNPTVYTGTNTLTMGKTDSASLIMQRNQLDDNINMDPSGGTLPGFQGDVWNAKLNWINSTAGSNTTTVAGITSTTQNSSQGTAYSVGTSNMTFGASGSDIWAFMTSQIQAGEDVELGLYNHMVTLMGISQSGTNMFAEIIDPNLPILTGSGAGPGAGGNGPVGEWVGATYDPSTGSSGLVQLSGFAIGSGTAYSNPGGPPGTADVFYAFAESAVPEPSTIALLGVGAIGLAGFAWRRRRRFAPAPARFRSPAIRFEPEDESPPMLSISVPSTSPPGAEAIRRAA